MNRNPTLMRPEETVALIEKHQSPVRFIPDVASERSNDWTGQRKARRLDRHTPIPWDWPTTPDERQEAFDAWHFVAMQVLHKANAGFRFVAIVPRFMDLRTGIVRGTNADFAAAAGGCHPETISRDISLCEKLCLFIGKRTRNLAPNGGYIVRRSLRLSLPQNIADIDLDRMDKDRT
ncbi:hypothetical protein [Brucella anthropi]|uniref:hypothetical protein n=1 Tax=Brucella anthropi TaxID=529 RepID=UPI0005B9CE6D|nr:hypothetical protein [Brucella anthropi]KIU70153.1 hypothetical protein TR92_02405 [Brucella anthropi]